jgi:cysteine synthase
MVEALDEVMGDNDRFAGVTLTTGSAGTIASGDYLKQVYPTSRIAAGEALRCPTMILTGFGEHRMEGIGGKHIPWIHDVKNTDMVIGLDDEATMSLIRLFNEPAGRESLAHQGIAEDLIERLPLLGISGVGNLLMAIKLAKYYELNGNDVIMTLGTDSIEMYEPRLIEMNEKRDELTATDAAGSYHRHLMGQEIDHAFELSYYDRKRIHNLKY